MFKRGDSVEWTPRHEHFIKILRERGYNKLEKSRASIQEQLAAHRVKLDFLKANGGFTSSVEKEITNFEADLNAIRDVVDHVIGP